MTTTTYTYRDEKWVESEPNVGERYKIVTDLGNKGQRVFESEKSEVSTVNRARFITVAAFRRRMTLQEKVALETANDPVVNVLDRDLSDSTYVDLDLPLLKEGLDYIAANIPPFTPERVQELLVDGQDIELYKGDL